MSDKHPFFSVIGLSAAFGAFVFVAVQYVQVKPLEIDLVKAKEEISNNKKLIKVSPEYLGLQKEYFSIKAKLDLISKELDAKIGIENKLNLVNIGRFRIISAIGK